MGGLRCLGWGLLATLIFVMCSCGDDGGETPAAGAGAPPVPGERCAGAGTCTNGGTCERTGQFAGICTSQCDGDAACQLLRTELRCFNGRCALRCAGEGECPSGTACTEVGARMACVPQ